MNSHLYTERPNIDDPVPEEDQVDQMGDIHSDTSEEPSTEEEKEEEKKEEVVQVKVKLSSLTAYEREALKQKELEKKNKPPVPQVPDVNKFDKIYILPFFCKPGKHQYMIKYKDLNEAG